MLRGRLKYLLAGAVVPLFLAVWVPSVFPAVNAVTGGIGGINNGTLQGGDGTGPAQITLNVTGLSLVKQARDLAGNVLPDNSDVVPGQEIYFVLFVDNPTAVAAGNLRITDQINEAEFTYIQSSVELTVLPTGSDDGTIWAGSWSHVSDSLGGPDDGASVIDTGGTAGRDRLTVGTVPGQANQAVDVPGDSILAVRFRVRVN